MFSSIQINRKFWINLICFILGVLLLFYLIIKYRVAPTLSFADLKLTTLASTPAPLSDYKEKVIVLNFWKTWCGTCLGEMPSIDKAQALSDTSKIVFILVSDEGLDKISTFKTKHVYSFQYLVSNKSLSELGINTYPTTYIIDKNGKVAYTQIGSINWSSKEIVDLLKDLSQ